ncbi:sugar ABC transporter permease [Chloroflexi bacterium TSY]|nr:sugar ABC transporter permease [Chloroflexi bacterium TSY]
MFRYETTKSHGPECNNPINVCYPRAAGAQVSICTHAADFSHHHTDSFVFTIYYSFQNWNLLRPGNINWIGIRNYVRAFENPDFLRILWNTLVLSVSVVVITFSLGMCFALLLNRPFPGRGIARTLLISPFLVMPVVTAVLWKNVLLNPAFGLATFFLSLFGLPPIDWLAHYAMPSVIATVSWQWSHL